MSQNKTPLILSIDDDRDFLNLIDHMLTPEGYRVMTIDDSMEGIKAAHESKPNLILLDVKMKDLDGYEICSRLQSEKNTAYIPVIFVTVLDAEQNRAMALSVGGVDYLVKPVKKELLLEIIRKHIKTDTLWKTLHEEKVAWYERIQQGHYIKFKEYLFERLNLGSEEKYILSDTAATKIYDLCSKTGIKTSKMAQYIADFLSLSYADSINPENILLGVLPTPFCRSNHVLVASDASGKKSFVISNPFNWDCMEHLKRFAGLKNTSKIIISEPENIDILLRYQASKLDSEMLEEDKADGDIEEIETLVIDKATQIPESEVKKNPIIYVANIILDKAASENVSDIHILPKETDTIIRFRIDGDLREFYRLKKNTGVKLISRYKVLGDLDISEKRKPRTADLRRTLIKGLTTLESQPPLRPMAKA